MKIDIPAYTYGWIEEILIQVRVRSRLVPLW
jgi:hypothetical protein